jgi:flagellar biosynthesis/type III secretory pathway M-ring protein FliF/YscJ
MVTAAMFLFAYLSSVPRGFVLLAWCLIVGIILIPLIKSLRYTESKESPKSQKNPASDEKPQEGKASSHPSTKTYNYSIEEISSKTINKQNLLESIKRPFPSTFYISCCTFDISFAFL